MTDDAQDAQDAQDDDAVRTADGDRDDLPDEHEMVLAEDEARFLKAGLRAAGMADSTITGWEKVVRRSGADEPFADSEEFIEVAHEAQSGVDEPTPAELLRNFNENDRRWTGDETEYLALNTAITTWLHKRSLEQGEMGLEYQQTVLGLFNKIRDAMSALTGNDMGTIQESMSDMLEGRQ